MYVEAMDEVGASAENVLSLIDSIHSIEDTIETIF